MLLLDDLPHSMHVGVGNATAHGADPAADQSVESDAQSQPSEQRQEQQSSAGSKSSKQKEKKDKAKADKEKKSSKGKDKGKKKGKNRDLEDLKSKLPPDLKTFDFNDLHDLDSLKAKLEEMKLSKEGMELPRSTETETRYITD